MGSSLHPEVNRGITIADTNEASFFAAPIDNSLHHAGRDKRVLDVLAALGGLIIAAPILALAALLVKLDSPGPAFYSQERLGLDGVPFRILKLRTMTADAESRTGPVWAADNDPRITRVGRWLRKIRIDELPQVVNVLRGEMSIVGPRPEREFFVRQLVERVPHYAQRLMVRPGITGWAQITQPYAASVVESCAKLQADLYYLRHMSVSVDIQIILETARVVLLGHEREVGTGALKIQRLASRIERLASKRRPKCVGEANELAGSVETGT